MDQEQIIKLTLASQIAGQVIKKINFENKTKEDISVEVVDLTKTILNDLLNAGI